MTKNEPVGSAMTDKPPSLWTDVDYERNGKQIGWLHLHHSVTRSAYGDILIPVACLKNGSGKTLLLMAGNHGDEYEGQILLSRLVRELDAGAIRGRVIILTAANLPAALAGTRTSPLDQGNLNRSFPGDPDGGPTSRIAHYIDSVLLPLADAFIDLHAGGASLDYMPFCSMRLSGNPDLDRRSRALLETFAPPLAFVWAYSPAASYSASGANRRGIPSLGGEYGGGGGLDRAGMHLAETGVRRVMKHLGITTDAPAPLAGATRFLEVASRDYYAYAPEPGVFEHVVDLGDTVAQDDLAGFVHFPDNPAREPIACHFRTGGLVVCRRAMGRCDRGDCLFHLATDIA
jgi:uncharacterized protein